MHKGLSTALFTLALSAGIAVTGVNAHAQEDRDRHDQGQWQQDRDDNRQSHQNDRDHDRDRDHDYDRDRDRDKDHDRGNHYGQYKHGNGRDNSAAYQSGYQDGLTAGAHDRDSHHSFRPTEGDRYRDADRGYSSTYGDKDMYRQDYRDAYQRGYEEAYKGQGASDNRYSDRDHDNDRR